MAQAYSTGPCGAWVSAGLNSTPRFLGHSDNGFRITARPAWYDVECDVAGKVPYDLAFGGEECFVVGRLTRWNEGVRQGLSGRPVPFLSTEGTNEKFERGSLMLTEFLAPTLYIKFPFSVLPAFGTLRPGFRFRRAIPIGPDEHGPGTKPYGISMIFHCLGEFDPATESFVLADFVGLNSLSID